MKKKVNKEKVKGIVLLVIMFLAVFSAVGIAAGGVLEYSKGEIEEVKVSDYQGIPCGEYTVLNIEKYKGYRLRTYISVTLEDSEHSRYCYNYRKAIFRYDNRYEALSKLIPGDKVVLKESGMEFYYNKKVE